MKIGLLGHGVVGSGVRRIIDAKKTDEVSSLSIRRILVKDASEITDERMTLNVSEILEDPEIDTIAECMGGLEPAHSYVLQALKSGKNAVTSNKKMLASFYEELSETAAQNHVRLMYEASTGGGIPWMAEIRRTRRIDAISGFRGIFNGTTNYILSNMSEKHMGFVEMLKEAQKLGYAEKDPTDDLDGYDVQYKCCLSSAAAFSAIVSPSEISRHGIHSVSEKEMQFASKNHRTLKLIGSGVDHGNSVSLWVIPCFLKNEDVLSHVSLNYNGLETESETLGKSILIGQGAGSLPTAHAVVQDLIAIQNKEEKETYPAIRKQVDNQLVQSVYYVRTHRQVCFMDVLDRQIDEDSFLTRKISLSEIEELAESAQDENLFLGEVSQ